MELCKSVRTKLYPNAKQKALLHRMFGHQRFVFNQLLGLVKDHHFGDYKKDPSKPNIPSEITLIKEITALKEKHTWLYESGNGYLQAVGTNLFSAFSGFYKGGGYPKFKSRKNSKQSISMYAGSRAKIKDGFVYINGKSKEKIKFSNHFSLPEEHKITNYTISKDSVGDYWLSFTYKTEIQDKNYIINNPIGCDLGLKRNIN